MVMKTQNTSGSGFSLILTLTVTPNAVQALFQTKGTSLVATCKATKRKHGKTKQGNATHLCLVIKGGRPWVVVVIAHNTVEKQEMEIKKRWKLKELRGVSVIDSEVCS